MMLEKKLGSVIRFIFRRRLRQPSLSGILSGEAILLPCIRPSHLISRRIPPIQSELTIGIAES